MTSPLGELLNHHQERLHTVYGGSELANRCLVFNATANSTCLTAYAFTQINRHGVAFAYFPFTVWLVVIANGCAGNCGVDSGNGNERSTSGNFAELAEKPSFQ